MNDTVDCEVFESGLINTLTQSTPSCVPSYWTPILANDNEKQIYQSVIYSPCPCWGQT